MDIRLFILSLACMACVVPSHGELLTAKLLAKKALGAAIFAGKAALIKKGLLGHGASKLDIDCGPARSSIPRGFEALNKVHSIIEQKKKLFGNIIGLKKKMIGNVIEKKNQLIEGLSKPERVVVVQDVPQEPLFIDVPAHLEDFPQLVEFPSFPPHQVVDLPQFPPQYVNVDVPSRPAYPKRFYPAPPPPPFLHLRGPIYPAERIAIRNEDCL